ncbi:MAG TPA: hypothetical protein VEA62_06190 [Brevundimonas sp.]|nr:hypothetical protein [Brevundimonas sp.]
MNQAGPFVGRAMDEETLRSRAELWRRRAAQTLDSRERAASAELADQYEALLVHLLESRDRRARAD